ncbi:MAG: T9SS type A sorting domain-containing protein [Sphingobacteriales bacterium]|nr:MAG: T9SS type A sorting domain-containing protein [Sphingobacteriales bacterium]
MRNYTPSYFRSAIILCIALLMPALVKAQYCTSYNYCYSWGLYCAGFSTTGATSNINVTSGCSNQGSGSNSYNSTNVISAIKGTSFNFTISNGPSSYMYYNIYVDWNNDNDFTDAGESVFASGYTSYYGTQTGTINVPSTASVAIHRLRVQASYYGNGTPCYTYWGNGETEDYDLNVLPSCAQATGIAASNITGNSADINWNAVTGALGYEYVLDQTSANPTTAGTFTTANNVGAFGLNSSSMYYLHLRTKCNATDYSLWTKISFATIFNPCPYPGGISVNTPTASTADFSWSAVTGSLGYYYVISPLSTAPTVPGISTSGTTASKVGLMPGATYYFYLRNQCSTTSISDWTRQQFTMPECSLPGSVLTTMITDTSADFIWGTSSNAGYYEYQVDPNVNPPASGSGFLSTTGMSAHVEGLIPQTKYYVHIRSRCFVNDSSAWLLDSLVTQMGCLVPQVVVTNANTNNPSISWPAVPNAMTYEYRMSHTNAAPAYGTETSALSVPPTTLPDDGRDYYMHVRTKCSQFSFSRWNTSALRLSGTAVNNIKGKGFSVDAHPNPVKNILHVKVNGGNEEATVMLIDVTGKIVRQSNINGEADINTSGLATGVYVLKYSSSAHSQVIKVTKE